MKTVLKLGTRGSKLALIQAESVRAKLTALDPSLTIEIIPIQTEGDINKTQPLHEIGGKGVFIKTLEDALVSHEIDEGMKIEGNCRSSIHN